MCYGVKKIIGLHLLNNLIVSKSNYLIQASYRLTLKEQRLVLIALGKIDSRKVTAKKVTITSLDYADCFGLNRKDAPKELYLAIDLLWGRSVKVSLPDVEDEFRWVQRKLKYKKGDGKITFFWSDEIMVYISQLKKQFTSFKLQQVSSLKSVHSIRIFELLMQFKSTKTCVISVPKFRHLLELEDKYSHFKELKRSVILPALSELELKSNLKINFSTIKDGRKIAHLCFDFREDPQLKLDL